MRSPQDSTESPRKVPGKSAANEGLTRAPNHTGPTSPDGPGSPVRLGNLPRRTPLRLQPAETGPPLSRYSSYAPSDFTCQQVRQNGQVTERHSDVPGQKGWSPYAPGWPAGRLGQERHPRVASVGTGLARSAPTCRTCRPHGPRTRGLAPCTGVGPVYGGWPMPLKWWSPVGPPLATPSSAAGWWSLCARSWPARQLPPRTRCPVVPYTRGCQPKARRHPVVSVLADCRSGTAGW